MPRPPRLVTLIFFCTFVLLLLVRSFASVAAHTSTHTVTDSVVFAQNTDKLASTTLLEPPLAQAAHVQYDHKRPVNQGDPHIQYAPVQSALSRSTWTFFELFHRFTLFPPLAIVSLMDDNSTAFPARPAAFGPALESSGFSGQLWVGSSFSDDHLPEGEGDGELGCSDIPNWGGVQLTSHTVMAEKSQRKANTPHHPDSPMMVKRAGLDSDSVSDHKFHRQRKSKDKSVFPNSWKAPLSDNNDGTDDYLHQDALIGLDAETPDATGPGSFSHADIQSMQEAAEIAGKIVLLSRGGCGFLEKVKWAQRRGAVALIIGDNRRGGPLIQMYARGDITNVTIPSIFVSRTTGQLLAALSQPGSFIEDTVNEHGKPSIKVQHSDKAAGKTKNKSGGKTKVTPSIRGSSRSRSHFKRNTDSEKSQNSNWFTRLFCLDTNGSHVPKLKAHDLAKTQDRLLSQRIKQDASKHGVVTQQQINSFVFDGLGWKSASQENSVTQKNKEFMRVDDDSGEVLNSEDDPYEPREGLWITITPSGSVGSFFDTILVVLISPVVTLSIVYSFVIIRTRIQNHRWRVPKSVVQRLPVHTYRRVAWTPSPLPSPRLPSPTSTSPTTSLLQPVNTETFVEQQATASSSSGGYFRVFRDLTQGKKKEAKDKQDKKPDSQWQKYMSRQSECVVCLEEYIDGVSQVMSLPCGHEFHEECITPWLISRRRTCPICKGDVVQSLERRDSISSSESSHFMPPRRTSEDDTLEASAFRIARSIAASIRPRTDRNASRRPDPLDLESQANSPTERLVIVRENGDVEDVAVRSYQNGDAVSRLQGQFESHAV